MLSAQPQQNIEQFIGGCHVTKLAHCSKVSNDLPNQKTIHLPSLRSFKTHRLDWCPKFYGIKFHELLFIHKVSCT